MKCTYPLSALLLLLAVVSSQLTPPPVAVPCAGQLHPGMLQMTYGIDLTSIELYTLPHTDSIETRFRAPVIALTCNRNRTWRHPHNGALQFTLPDQIGYTETSIGASESLGDMARRVNVYRRSSDFLDHRRRSMNVNVYLHTLDQYYGAFSQSDRLMEVQESLYRNRKTVAEAWYSFGDIKVHLHHVLKPTEDFLASLPNASSPIPSYESSPQVYDTLLAKYGTHFFDRANFGGAMFIKAKIDQAYTKTHDDIDIGANLKGALLEELRLPSSDPHDPSKASQTFREASQFETRHYGGEFPFGRDPNWIQQWKPSVQASPWLLSGTLHPIQDLIADPKVKVEVGKAISLKMAQAYLDELNRMAEMRQFPLTPLENQLLSNAKWAIKRRAVQEVAGLTSLLETIYSRINYLNN